MNKLTKPIALFACLALVLGLLPGPAAAADTVSGADLRAGVVQRVDDIMNVEWSLESRISKSITGDDLAAFQAGGILPTTYFEYVRLHFSYRGVMVESEPATLEEFAAMAKPEYSVIDGIGHNIYTVAEQKGMDINSFLTDITTFAMAQPLTGLRQALTHPELTALAEGANLSAASSKAAIGYDAAKAGYAKLGKGDLLLAWDDAATGLEGGGPRIHALVVKEVSGDQVTVMYPAFSLLLWFFECSKCGMVETEGPTSAALPEHIQSDGYSFGQLKTHGGCGGEWTPQYATTWRTETVSYDQLYGQGDAAVPYASKGYLPYTLKAYTDGAPVADIRVSTDINAENYLNGFTAKVSSDWAITGVKSAILRDGTEVAAETGFAPRGSKELTFTSDRFNEALRQCPSGTKNTLVFYVRSGPMDSQALAQDSYRKVFSMDFTVQNDAMTIKANKAGVEQGESFTVTVSTMIPGITGLQQTVVYDEDFYVFEPQATREANPGLNITAQAGTVTVTRLGAPLGADARVAELVFHAKRTGEFPTEADKNGAIYCGQLLYTTKADPTQADLKVGKADTTSLRLSIGQNVIIYGDYVQGKDLLLLFTATAEQKNNTTTSALPMAYDGKPMYDVTRARYETGEGDIQRIYAVLVDNADISKISRGTVACPQLTYSDDVNQNGCVELMDVQTISNIINGRLPYEGNEAKWFMADVDRSGKVDLADMQALWNTLMG